MQMTENRRQLLLQICDGHPGLPPYLYHLTRFRRCDEILGWLVQNRITGKRFLEWVVGEHNRSILNAGAQVIARLEREKKSRPILADQDYLI